LTLHIPGVYILGASLDCSGQFPGIELVNGSHWVSFGLNMTKQPLTTAELTELTAGLHKLARNLWWTWDQEAQEVFAELSPRAWMNLYHNGVAVLHELSDYELRVRLQNPELAARVREVLKEFHKYMSDKETWGRKNAPALVKNPVAYFSAEFGFHETLPIAAGGLGMLAGDHTKSASDLDLGFVGISLFYREGYFQQAIDQNNWQTEYYTLLNPKNLPIDPVLNEKGEPVVCQVEIGLNQVFFQAWKVTSGASWSIYLIRIGRRTSNTSVTSLSAFTVATARPALCRRSCWVSAGSACCGHLALSPLCST